MKIAAVALVAIAMLASSSSTAAAPAPHLHWQTIKTACCDVHYPAAQHDVGARVAAIADDAIENAATLLRQRPLDRVQIVLHDVIDAPNGFANVVPYDRVELRAVTPPSDSELGKSDDWLRLLVQHELLHIVHLDVIHGFPAVVNLVLGERWPPNVVQPRAFVEGLAVYAETRFTRGGRLRSSLFRTPLRIAALNGDRWSLDDVSNSSRRPPGGTGAYLYGAYFIDFMAARYGTQFIAAWAHDYGGRVIPYAVQRSMASITGRDFALDWADFQQQLLDDARADEARVRDRGGPTTTRRLTRMGGTIHRPVFLDDGALVFGSAPPDGPPGIYAIRGLPNAVPQPVPIIRTTEIADVATVEGSDMIVFAQTEVHDRWSSFRDLFTVDVDGRVRQRTFAQRLHSPARWPQHPGHVVAEQRTGSVSRIVDVDIDSGAVTAIATAPAGITLYSPMPSPDGSRIAISRLDDTGRRRIAILDVAADSWAILGDGDGGDQLDPSWKDDDEIVFVDDSDGIFTVRHVNLRSGERHRLVDTLGNAQRPITTPDGSAVIFTDMHLDGVDLYAAAITPAPTRNTTLSPTPLIPLDVPAPAAVVALDDVVHEPYSVLPTILPRTWSGGVGVDGVLGPSANLSVDGSDAVGLIDWSLQVGWTPSLITPLVVANARFSNLTLPTTFGLELRPVLADRGRITDGVVELQREDQLRATVSTSIPFRRRRFSHALGFGAQRLVTFDHLGVTSSPDALAPRYPDSVRNPQQTIVNVDWSYNGVESYRDSVSTERGVSAFVRVRVGDPLLLSEVTMREVVADLRAYQPLPGLTNHVVAAYFSGAATLDDRVGSAWAVGGYVDRSLLSDAIGGIRSGGGALRGYPVGHVVGDVFSALTLEYRLPLIELERGVETLPIFLDRLHGAVFVDSAAAIRGDRPGNLQLATGIGVEARLSVVIGYYGALLFRFGYARGLGVGGVDQPYAILGVPY